MPGLPTKSRLVTVVRELDADDMKLAAQQLTAQPGGMERWDHFEPASRLATDYSHTGKVGAEL